MLLLMFMSGKSIAEQSLLKQLLLSGTESSRLRLFNALSILHRHTNNMANLHTAKLGFLKRCPLLILLQIALNIADQIC